MTRTTYRHPARPQALAAAALRAAASGWAVFPVRPRGKTPAVPGWEDAATVDPDRILAWWDRAAWNIGITAGRSGLLVVDLDVPVVDPHPADEDTAALRDAAGAASSDPLWSTGHNLTDGAHETGFVEVMSGSALLRKLATDAAAPEPWDTFTVATPSGGRHLYFRQPDGSGLRNTQGALGPLIDTRGHGGYILAAGSRGPDRQRYRILRDGPVAPLPAWLHDALTPLPPPDIDDVARPGHDHPSGEVSSPGDDGPTDPEAPIVSIARAAAYLRAVVEGESRAVTAAPVGTRHTTLLRAARRLGHWVGSGALTTTDAREALTAAARGYVGVDGYTARQIERDITDGLAYGAQRPRHIDDLDQATHRGPDAHR